MKPREHIIHADVPKLSRPLNTRKAKKVRAHASAVRPQASRFLSFPKSAPAFCMRFIAFLKLSGSCGCGGSSFSGVR